MSSLRRWQLEHSLNGLMLTLHKNDRLPHINIVSNISLIHLPYARKGDYHRYLAEFSQGEERKGVSK